MIMVMEGFPNLQSEVLESNPEDKAEEPATGVSSEEVFEKTEQGIRILSNLWDKRLGVVGEYYGQRNKKRFNLLKSDETIVSEIGGILAKLGPINTREEKVVEILERGANNAQEVLSHPFEIPEGLSEEEIHAVSEFNEKTAVFSEIIGRYTDLVSQHKDILELERELVESPDEGKFELYLKRMEAFVAEFKALQDEKVDGLKEYFTNIEADLRKAEEAMKQGKPLEYLKQSAVSAVVRVVVSNIAAGFIVGDPLKNPYFWQLMAATIPTVLAVNYVDYYFKVFTKVTQRINSVLK